MLNPLYDLPDALALLLDAAAVFSIRLSMALKAVALAWTLHLFAARAHA